jgi:hypothetical protein
VGHTTILLFGKIILPKLTLVEAPLVPFLLTNNSLYDTANPESAGVLYGEFPANVPGDSCVAKHPNAMSFDYYADDITGYTLGVQTSIKCEKNGILYLIVTSSIFS